MSKVLPKDDQTTTVEVGVNESLPHNPKEYNPGGMNHEKDSKPGEGREYEIPKSETK